VSEAAEELHRIWRDSKFQEGLHLGASEAFASMVVHGHCTVLGKEVMVSFTWQDDRHEEMTRTLARDIMQRACEAGRQQEPPPI